MKRWTVGEARRRMSELLRAAAKGPQRIFSRDRLVAVVVDPATFEELEAARPPRGSLADDFDALRRICVEEDYELPVAPRVDRASAFEPTA